MQPTMPFRGDLACIEIPLVFPGVFVKVDPTIASNEISVVFVIFVPQLVSSNVSSVFDFIHSAHLDKNAAETLKVSAVLNS
uniref:Uncharacterized protein n=1 Tax=Ciona intestinalis TaxID=7719 RepID=H2XL67_CIOIN